MASKLPTRPCFSLPPYLQRQRRPLAACMTPFPNPQVRSKSRSFEPASHHLTRSRNMKLGHLFLPRYSTWSHVHFSPTALLVYGRQNRKEKEHTPNLPPCQGRRQKRFTMLYYIILHHITLHLSLPDFIRDKHGSVAFIVIEHVYFTRGKERKIKLSLQTHTEREKGRGGEGMALMMNVWMDG